MSKPAMPKPPKWSFGEQACHQIFIFGGEINKIEIVKSKALSLKLSLHLVWISIDSQDHKVAQWIVDWNSRKQHRAHLKESDYLILQSCLYPWLALWIVPKYDLLLTISIFFKWDEHTRVTGHMLSATTINNPMSSTGLVVHLHTRDQAFCLGTQTWEGPLTFSTSDLAIQIFLGLFLFGDPRTWLSSFY
jgi:hypothetical protein